MKKAIIMIVAIVGVLAMASGASAALIVYEGFDYGPDDKATLVGESGGVGLAGSWMYWTDSAGDERYEADGLSFSDLPVTGGRAELYVNYIKKGTLGRALGVSRTGTIWGSYLFSSDRDPGTVKAASGVTASRVYNGSDFDGNMLFTANATSFDRWSGDLRLSQAVWSHNPGTALAQNEIGLVLFKVEGLAPFSGARTITGWILNVAQYDNFKSGGVTEAELNAAALGTAATEVLQRHTVSGNAASRFTTADFLCLNTYDGIVWRSYDEIRFSDSSLAETLTLPVVIPEPAGLGLVGLALLAVRRKRS